MNRDDIIRMVRQAGGYLATEGVNWMPILGIEYAEKFAKLVAAHEREECAKLCDEQATDYEESDPWNGCARYLANYIRARGEK